MKKLIYIANARIPTEKAHGKQIVKTVEALAKYYPSIELWLPRREQIDYFKQKDISRFYQLRRNFSLKFFPTLDFLIKLKNFPPIFQTSAFFLQEASFVFSLIASHPQFDLFYSRSLIAAVALKLTTSKKVIYEAHNLTSNQVLRKIYPFFLTLLDGVVVISQGLRSAYESIGASKVLVASDGVDLTEFGKRSSQAKKNSKVAIIYTGSLQVGKGVDDLIMAAALLSDKKYQFQIVGGFFSGNDKERLLNLLKEKEVRNVKLMGYVSPREIPKILLQANILVLPNSAKNVTDRKYTSPMKLFEYLASGVPIIASATPANREVLVNKRNSLLFRPDDPVDLAKKIMKIANDHALQKKLSANAQRDAKGYTWEKRAQKISNFLESL